MYKLKREIHFYETDMMGIVHHSNYLRYFEDGRIDWLKQNDLFHPEGTGIYPIMTVMETQCQHRRPVTFNDTLILKYEVRRERLKIRFQYAIFLESSDELVASGMSLHVLVGSNHKPCKMPANYQRVLENEKWTETWP